MRHMLRTLVLLAVFSAINSLTCAAGDIPSRKQRQALPLPMQQFVCNTGYSVADCVVDSKAVRSVVALYHGEDLGTWTWILVRSEDWAPLMEKLKLNPASPALTVLEMRATFLEEALLRPSADRAARLMDDFGFPLNQMIDLAITHEMGHAVCRNLNEFGADQFGRQLREGRHPTCAGK